jgi:predicted nucleotidyltransferase
VLDPLKALVVSEARAKVLTALFAADGRPFYQQELARATGLPLRAVQRELRRLTAAGLVSSQIAGGRRVYTADSRASIHGEIASMIRKLRGPAAALRSALTPRHEVELAFVFGSFAAGSATVSSDIDLMVIGPDSARSVRTALQPVERELGRTLNEHVLTKHEWADRLRKSDPFLSNVRAGPKLWVVGDEEGLARADRDARAR